MLYFHMVWAYENSDRISYYKSFAKERNIIVGGFLRKESIEMHIHLGYLSIYKYLHCPSILKYFSII